MRIVSLKNQLEFDQVNKFGKKRSNQYFIAVHAKNFCAPTNINVLSTIYLGMKVGKKLGKAVVRNKIKRRIRHLAQLSCNNINVYDRLYQLGIIIIPKKGFEKVKFATLLEEFTKIVCNV